MNQSPSQSLSTYQTATSGVLDYLKNQLSSFTGWNNVAGGLVKVASSPSGYTWGYNSRGGVYVCKNPCSPPNWKRIIAEDSLNMLDMAIDSSAVYFLIRKSAQPVVYKINDVTGNNPEDTEFINPPQNFIPSKMTVTNGFIQLFSRSGSVAKLATCAKPCKPPAWNIKDSASTRNGKVVDQYDLVGAGGQRTYFKSTTTGQLLKSDETVQTGMTPVAGMQGINLSSLAAEADNSVIYGADVSKVYRCEGTCDTKDAIKVVDTEGRLPIQTKGSLSVNPTDRTVWMLTSDYGQLGNIFQRLDAPDVSGPVLDYANRAENERDRIVNSLGGTMAVQTAQISSGMARQEVVDAFKQLADLSGDKGKVDNEIQILERKIEQTNSQISGYKDKNKPLVILLISLAVVALMYITVGWFMPYGMSMGLAVIILGAGLGLSIYFSTTK